MHNVQAHDTTTHCIIITPYSALTRAVPDNPSYTTPKTVTSYMHRQLGEYDTTYDSIVIYLNHRFMHSLCLV